MSRFFERFILCCSKFVQHYFENKGSYNYCITIVFTPQNTPIVKKNGNNLQKLYHSIAVFSSLFRVIRADYMLVVW